jgi:amino acid adenylation domain-containing protein
MSLNLLLERLASKKITLGVAGSELSVKAPQGAMDADTLALIREYKQALIALLSSEQAPEALRHADGRAPEAARITPEMLPLVVLSQAEIDQIARSVAQGTANIQDIYPLAPLQEGILFHHLLESEGDAYVIRSILAFEERGRLDAFLAALQQVIDRHDILRSSIRWEGLNQPVQVVCRHAPLPVETIELDGGASALAQLQALTDPRHLRLDLQRAPLLAAYIGRDPASGEWLLALLNHHIVSDHMTLEFIIAEIGELLQGRGDGLPAALPYRNFIAQVHSVSEAEHEAYFRRQLGAIDEPSALFGLLNVQHDGSRIDEVKLALDSALAQRIRDSARVHGMSAAVLFHVAWSLVVARCSGRDDVVFGTVLSGRLQGSDGAGQVLGMFLNTLPIRITQAGLSVRQVVHNAHQAMSELLAHEQAPLALAQRCSGVSAPMPLFTSLLNYRHSKGGAAAPGKAGAAMAWAGIRVIAAEERTNYPVTVSVDDLGTEFALTAQCAQGIDPARIATYLCEAASVLVQALAHNPDQQFDALSILPAAEQRQLIDEFNDAERAYAGAPLVHQLFEAQCARDPDAIAVRFNQEQLSYDQLNRRANHLAHQLLALGVQAGDRVAICSERSADMIAGLLGILKAGCAYVPLDPAYPAERLAYMVDNSAPVALLTQAALRASLPFADALPVLLLEPGDAHADDGNPDAAALGLRADQLAYIIYTSGSTGQPKGVAVTHEPVTNVIEWVNTRFCVDQNDTLLLTTSLCFDLSVYDIFGTLAAGACVRIASERDIADPRRLLHILCHEEITFWDSAPAVFGQLLPFLNEFPAPAGSSRLRLAFFSGDWIPLDLPVKLRQTFTQCQVVSLGGATEATVWSNFFPIDQVDPKWTSIPYGRPIQNARYYVLDRHLLPCPIGVAGDLYIGGSCLSAGYFNKPALTAERFVHDPFHRPGARMYKTGDRARYWEDGNLEFLGRNDFQVKIRGFRVELGEIEARLLACDGVREALVVARADVHGDKRLVAYVVGIDGATPDAALLRATLAESLADYMLPSAFVALASFPLTSNGKLDRQALPAPDQSAVIMREFVAPVGDSERVLADIWEEMLELPGIGRHDHFFELGGHSLLAVRLVSRLRQQLGVEVALRDLFAHPTLCGLAAIVQQARRASEAAIPRADREQPLPLSWAQQRLWFLDQFDHAAGAAYHMAVALRLDGALDHAALQATLDRIVARHESLRTAFPGSAGAPVQHIAPAGCGFALRNEDLRALDQEQQQQAVAALGAASASAPFDLASGPLIRGSLLRLADQAHILLLTQHHIITDGWSIGILVREVSTLYAAFSQGLPDPLPALPIQYADYAAWQRQWLQGQALQDQIDFWRTTLAGAPALIELPLDRPRPPVQSYAGASVAVHIAPELAASLRRLAQQHGCTVFMTLLAGWASLLARLSGQTDVVIGTPVANRQRSEVEGVIGFFVNTLALRVRFEDNPSVADLLAQVKAGTLAAYSHQDLPFEQVVEAVQPPRSLSHSPVFQTLLSLDNTPDGGGLAMQGLTLTPLALPHVTAHFDLSLALTDAAGALAGTLEYAADLFAHGTVERLAAQFTRVLEAMVADAAQSIGDLPLMSPAERAQLLLQFNDTAVDIGAAQMVHQVFEANAAAQPDAIALVCEHMQLSYSELNERANALAYRLLALGVQPDQRVAICVERGVDMVAGLLGILKAGAAYVPLDPAYPAERLAFMLADSAPVALVTQSALQPHLPALALPVIVTDAQAEPGSAGGYANPDPARLGLTPHHLAYVIYTSGSTGMPKGVMIEHAGLANFARTLHQRFDILPGSRFLQFASFSFDASISEISMTLCAGATLYVLPNEQIHSGQPLTDTLARHAITHVILAPSVVTTFPAQARLDGLNLIAVGESCPPALAQQWAGKLRLFNAYGPTETTVCATMYRCEADFSGTFVPIGQPIANTQIYILDARGAPVPLGVSGELYIGGAGVARGYLNRPDLTEERFRADPFSARPGARLYKTGDVGRWLADGNIEYLGRNDFQVKIRGFRIELGEVEARLAACRGVREAIVVAREDLAGDKRLVAYLLAKDGAELDAASLRAELGRELASYMLPSAYVTLEAFPLTPNGKLDRHALPAPDRHAHAARPYLAPLGTIEQALAEIWQELLTVALVGRDDHFFDIGGHSLLAVQLQVRIRERLHVAPTLKQVFEHPVLAQLAELIAAMQVTTYLGTDLEQMQDSLDGLSEEELRAILAEEEQ